MAAHLLRMPAATNGGRLKNTDTGFAGVFRRPAVFPRPSETVILPWPLFRQLHFHDIAPVVTSVTNRGLPSLNGGNFPVGKAVFKRSVQRHIAEFAAAGRERFQKDFFSGGHGINAFAVKPALLNPPV